MNQTVFKLVEQGVWRYTFKPSQKSGGQFEFAECLKKQLVDSLISFTVYKVITYTGLAENEPFTPRGNKEFRFL